MAARWRLLVAGALVTATGAVAPAAGAAPPAPSWQANVGGAATVTAPEIGGGRVYVGYAPTWPSTCCGGVRAFDLATGRVMWDHPAPAGEGSFATPDYEHATGRLYATIEDDILVLDAATGATLDQRRTDNWIAWTQIELGGDRLVVGDQLWGMDGFGTRELARRWSYGVDDDPSAFDMPGDGFLYLTDEDYVANDYPQCLEKVRVADGTRMKRDCDDDLYFGATPSVVPSLDRVVVATWGVVGAVRASDLAGGWRRTMPGYAAAAATPAGAGGRVAVAADTGRVMLLKATNGAQVCNRPISAVSTSVVPVFDASETGAFYVAAGASGRALVKVNPACRAQWRLALPGTVVGVESTPAFVVVTAGTTVTAIPNV